MSSYRSHAYLEPKGYVEPSMCDWCNNWEVCQDFFHGDMWILSLCGKCVGEHVYHLGKVTLDDLEVPCTEFLCKDNTIHGKGMCGGN